MFQRSHGSSPSASPRADGAQIRRLEFEQLEQRQLLAGQVTVHTSHPLGTISPELIGTNVIYSRESDALWNDGRVAASLKDLRTGFMRYPGGEVTSFYHWNSNTGVPFRDTWDGPVPVQPHSQWMSFDEYMRQVKLAGATPLVGINIQSGHNHDRVQEGIAEAVALVRYAQAKGYGVKHYFIDNEQYAENANMTATQYANYINLYADAMRKVDPALKIVVNWQGSMNDGWKVIFKIAGSNIDYVDFHAYWNRDAASFENWRGMRLMEHASETYFNKIQSFRQELERQGVDAKIAAFEWNLGPAKWGERPSPFQAALINSETFMQFVWARLDAATFWPLHFDANARGAEDDRSLLTAGDLEQSAVYQMLSMYKGLLSKELVGIEFLGSGVLAVAGYQQTTDTTTVMLLEKTGNTADLRIALGDFLKQPGSFEVQAQTFRAAGGDLEADRGEIVNIPYTLNRDDGTIRLSVGGYTLTKLTIRNIEGTASAKPPASPPPTTNTPPTKTPPENSPPTVDLAPPVVTPPKGDSTRVAPPPSGPEIVAPPVIAPPSAELPGPKIVPPAGEVTGEPPGQVAEPTLAPTTPPPETVSPLEEEPPVPPSAVDDVFDSLGSESTPTQAEDESLSLRALLAIIPDEVVTVTKRRGRFFLSSWTPDDAPLEF